jgi:DNA repair protein RecO (recombination protein O)
MAEEYTDKALVLRTGRFKEIDLWVRYLTPTRGVQTGFAFGGCRSRKRFCGCLDVLNEVVFQVKTDSRGRYLQLVEGTLVSGYPTIKRDQMRLGMAVNCLKFLEAVQLGHEGAAPAYDLMRGLLEVLEADAAPSARLPLYFRARTAFDQGWFPHLQTCLDCNEPIDEIASPWFAVERGGVVCERCRPRYGMCAKVSHGGLDLLRGLRASEPGDWLALEPSRRAAGEVFAIVDAFVDYHVGLAWQGGGYRRA